MDELRSMSYFTIGEVARRTGVAVGTLRAWERRYGVPQASRTPAGHRLYAQEMIDEIHRLKRYHDSGIRLQQAAALIGQRIAPEVGHLRAGIAAWQRRLKRACLRFDEEEAHAVLDDASRTAGVVGALRHIVFPVVRTLGDAWHEGLINISQEHYASHLARRVAFGGLGEASALNGNEAPVVLACAPEERHELGLLLLACELQKRGCRVLYLGGEMPVGALLATLDAVKAAVAVVGITIPDHLAPWAARRREVRRRKHVTFVWAGPGAASAAGQVEGLTVHAVDDAIQLVTRLLPRQRQTQQSKRRRKGSCA